MLRVFFLALFSLSLLSAPAQETGLTSVWEVTAKDGGDTKVYLAGSIHLLRDEDLPLPAAFDFAYEASDELVLEVASADMAGAQLDSMRLGMYGGKGEITDDLSPAAYRKLRAYLEGAGMPRDGMDGFRPWMAAMAISLTEMMKLGCRVENGVDAVVEGKAISDGKPVRSLETAEFQLGIFSKLNKKRAEEMLTATLRDMAGIEKDFPLMVDAWRTGDGAALDEIMNDSLRDQPALKEALLDKRNAAWMAPLEKKLAGDKDVMIVVGAGHLVGDGGLVALLKERGYRVRQLGAKGAPAPEKKGRFVEL